MIIHGFFRALSASNPRPTKLVCKKIVSATLAGVITLASTAFALAAKPGAAGGEITNEPTAGAFALIEKAQPADIFLDDAEDAGVIIAAENLQNDLAAIGGKKGAYTLSPQNITGERVILIGTIGQSQLIDKLIANGKFNTSIIGEWEAFTQTIIEAPYPGVAQALVIAGSDRRGTIYGVYDLSQRAGVSPWRWWADVPIKKSKNLFISRGARTEKPAVRYRGIFLNDERPALANWADEKFGGFNHDFYEKVFELILRLKGNYLWPAMWGQAFYDDDTENASLANKMGVVIGTSHHEPLARAHVEWARYGEGPWDYAKNKDRLQAFWRKGMQRKSDHEAIVTIGMRGDGDEAMTEETAIDLLETIVADQRRIIAETTGKAASETPQVWALYKEVQDYYDQGMVVPDDVTLLFSDDNWGNIRRLPKKGAVRPGGYGVYYHFDYVGDPRNYKWLNTTQIERVWEQMNLAHEYGATELWIVNVGDLKPMEFPISFFLDYAWSPEGWPLEKLPDYPAQWATEQFGETYAQQIGELLSRYTKFNARRKPELLSPEIYSLLNHDEAEKIVVEYNALAQEARDIGAEMPRNHRDAYFQLVQYPIEASANLNALYIAAAKNRLYAEQGRRAANLWADKVEEYFKKDAGLTEKYHELANGKWNHMMSQTHIGYTYWQQPGHNTMPGVTRIHGEIEPSFGVVFDGRKETVLDGANPTETLLVFDRNSASPPPRATIVNRTDAPFSYSIETPAWLSATPNSGEIRDEQEVLFQVDWTTAPAENTDTLVKIVRHSSNGENVFIDAPIVVRNRTPKSDAPVFVEANGYVSFMAADFTRSVDDSYEWKIIDNLGLTVSSISAFPRDPVEPVFTQESPRLEYDLYTFSAGQADIEFILSPTLDFIDQEGLRFGISIDDQPLTIVNVHEDFTYQDWMDAVAHNAHKPRTRLSIDRPGKHTLKLWLIDPALVFQKIVIETENIGDSYLGPPVSLKSGENN